MSAGIDWVKFRQGIRTPTPRTDDAYGHDRDEARTARQATPTGGCYSHRFHPDGRGGGVCRCGETLSAEEL